MAQCLTPITMRTKEANNTFPCGKCATCSARRASAWSFRLMQEAKNASSALFVTLTYNTEHVPISKNRFMTLNKRDLQLFFKKLRKRSGSKNIKYYAVGEYGGNTKRPHYHVILFNAKYEDIEYAWSLDQKKNKNAYQ